MFKTEAMFFFIVIIYAIQTSLASNIKNKNFSRLRFSPLSFFYYT